MFFIFLFFFIFNIFRATECLIIARSEVDVRVCDRYLFVFRYIFMHVADDQEAMTYFYNLPIFVESVGHVPNLRDNYKVNLIFFGCY